MDDFRVNNNQLTGTIPPELFSMSKATLMGLDSNSLSGPIPSTELLQMQDLIQLRLSRNQLTGTIPVELRDMSSLRLVWLHLNNLTGPMPDTVCEANVPDGLNFIQVDCGGDVPNPCRCCSACCDRVTEVCLTQSK
jgi:hypothetical protein